MITIGADPELFLVKGDRVVSAIGKIGGSKTKPKKVGNGIWVQEDNVLAEFNIVPCSSKEDFVFEIKQGIFEVARIASSSGCGIAFLASAILDKDQLRSRKAKMFGCDADFNAWSLVMNQPPEPNTNMRTAGGHIHVGGIDDIDNIQLVRAMDLFLGVPSIILDKDSKRMKMYGGAGTFRPKPYGIEYRTLSNFWLQSEKLIEWVYDNTLRAVDFVKNQNLRLELTKEPGKRIFQAINSSNKEMAVNLIEEWKITIP